MKMMFSRHQHSVITDRIDKLVTSEQFTLEVELEKLIKMIEGGTQYDPINNQMEAARAIRKQLKYGNTVQQSRALDLVNLFISQLAIFPAIYNDTKLLQRIQDIAMDAKGDSRGKKYNPKIVKKCVGYIMAWSTFIAAQAPDSGAFDGILQLGGVVRRNQNQALNTSQRKRSKSRNSKSSGSRSSGKTAHEDRRLTFDDDYSTPQLDITEETPKIKNLISDALAAATSLENELLALKKGELSTENERATIKYNKARSHRRIVLRYLQVITEGEFLGSLIKANEELVSALSKYDELAGYSGSSTEGSENSSLISEESVSAQPMTNPFDDHNKI
ncbi:HCL648Wp [Eremothecium sinecaudum]|uniref:HCL648Wp n=1 Tax=Eremothecium sinecaudum TaxID=45286 RepID=A0A109UXS8_9SACH|nr:HCL648Wp [Eremothecium sinecaudum]AMD19503.1 HCL648Wp [Eremothecium sinecaudum]